jgi:hypothetical protein
MISVVRIFFCTKYGSQDKHLKAITSIKVDELQFGKRHVCRAFGSVIGLKSTAAKSVDIKPTALDTRLTVCIRRACRRTKKSSSRIVAGGFFFLVRKGLF